MSEFAWQDKCLCLTNLWVMVSDLTIQKRIWFISKVVKDNNCQSHLIFAFLNFFMHHKIWWVFCTQMWISLFLALCIFIFNLPLDSGMAMKAEDLLNLGVGEAVIELLNRISFRPTPKGCHFFSHLAKWM